MSRPNEFHPNVKFTYEYSHKINFLDVRLRSLVIYKQIQSPLCICSTRSVRRIFAILKYAKQPVSLNAFIYKKINSSKSSQHGAFS